jgi:DNA-binding CsgD family transcriptional regulator
MRKIAQIPSLSPDEIKELYLSGVKVPVIANKCGVVPRTIRKHLSKMGIRRRSLRPITREEFEDLYLRKRLLQQEIARVLEITPVRVRKLIDEFGLQVRPHGGWRLKPPIDKDTLYRLYILERRSQKEIAKCQGLGQTTVSKWLRLHGVRGLKQDRKSEMKKSCRLMT